VAPFLLSLLLPFAPATAAGDGQRLVAAIQSGDPGAVALLLADGVAPDLRYGKDTAMTWAAREGAVEVMDLLRGQGAEPDADAALAACTEGRLAALERLLAWGIDPNTADPYEMTLLMTAALHGHADLVETLLAAGARVGDREVVQGYTALILAAAHGHADVVRLLLAAGADAHARTDNGETALGWARERVSQTPGHGEVVALLTAAGAGS
jgi:ankyrin repeat protein